MRTVIDAPKRLTTNDLSQKTPPASRAVPVGGIDTAAISSDFQLSFFLFFQKRFGYFDTVDNGNDMAIGAAGFAAGAEGFPPRRFA